MSGARRLALVSAALLLLVGCAGDDGSRADSASAGWQGTIETEGDVTTVVNESGSVWGGTARLVEEASIGVEAGAEEYMFGQVVGVYATGRYIYVSDRQAPALRMYTLDDGEHVRDIGREGQGPGEFTFPGIVRGDGQGRIFLQDHRGRHFNVYSEEGDYLDTWPAPEFACCASPMAMADDGLLWVRVVGGREPAGVPEDAVRRHGPDGPVGEPRFPVKPEFERAEIQVDFGRAGRSSLAVPFSPRFTWNIAHWGDIVAGASDRYRFEIQRTDGTRLVVEHYGKPTPIGAEEAEWHRRAYVASLRPIAASPSWDWDGAEMPATKPAFMELVPTLSGDVWVARQGPGERRADCVEDPLETGAESVDRNPCWRGTIIIDVFGEDGRYLGRLGRRMRPVGFVAATTFIRDDTVVAAVEDEAGTIRVKRYRLVLPGA